MLKNLWNDESGVILSAEIVLVGTILVLGMIVGLVEGDDFLPAYVIPFALLGILMSGYHYSIQMGVMGSSTSCAVGVPCSSRYVNFLGFITIPFMALSSFSLILITMLATKRATAQAALASN